MSIFLDLLLLALVGFLTGSLAMVPLQGGQVPLMLPLSSELQRVYPDKLGTLLEKFNVKSVAILPSRRLWYWPVIRSIIVVPEIRTPNYKALDKTSWKWLTALEAQHSIKHLVAVFDYSIDKDGTLIWQSLEKLGDALLNELLRKKEDISVLTTPIQSSIALSR